MNYIHHLLGKDADIITDRNFQLLLLVNLIGGLGINLVSPIIGSLQDPFGAAAGNIGLMISMFTLPAIVIIPLAGILADKYGRKPIMVAGLLLFGIAGMAISLTTNYGLVLVLRALQGVGFAGMSPIITTSIGDMYSGDEEATAQGLRLMSSGVSGTAYSIAAGVLIIFAWQYPFLIYTLAIPTAAILHQTYTETTPIGKTAITDGDRRPSRTDLIEKIVSAVSDKRVALAVIALGSAYLTYFGFFSYVSVLVTSVLGGSAGQAGIVVGTYSFAYAISATQSGKLAARLGDKIVPLIGANMLLGAGFVSMGLVQSVYAAYVGSIIFGFGAGITASLYRSVIVTIAPVRVRGSIVSFAESFAMGIATAAPVLMGLVIAYGEFYVGPESALVWSWIGVGLVGSITGVVCMLLTRRMSPR